MDNRNPEFDSYADEYKALTHDPIRERFAPGSEFFHRRKWELLADYMERSGIRSEESAWLDVGCGQGDLLRMGLGHFARSPAVTCQQECWRRARIFR